MKRLKLFVGLSVLFLAMTAFGENITLEQYLELVEKNNPQLHALSASIESAKKRLEETARALTPLSLTAEGSYTDDQFSGIAGGFDNIKTTAYGIGISKQFITGTGIAVGAKGQSAQSIASPSPLQPLLTDRQTTSLAPYVSVQQSLLKDLFNGYSRAAVNASYASARANLYNLEYSRQSFIIAAKSAYWTLSYSKTMTEHRQGSLQRYEQLLDWNTRRFRLDLAERADFLQAQASQKSAELNLTLALQSERQARRAFNQYINEAPDSEKYEVVDFDEAINRYGAIREIQKQKMRLDVLAARESAEAARFNQRAQKKNLGADLVLSGQYTANNTETDFTEPRTMDGPVLVVGLKYTMPLDFFKQRKVIAGYEDAAVAAQKSAESAEIGEKTDWQNLLDAWKIDLIRLEMAQTIRDFQMQYVEENRRLLQRGRTTTNALIQSEEGLDGAVLNVLGAVLSLITDYEMAQGYYNY